MGRGRGGGGQAGEGEGGSGGSEVRRGGERGGGGEVGEGGGEGGVSGGSGGGCVLLCIQLVHGAWPRFLSSHLAPQNMHTHAECESQRPRTRQI